MAAVFRGTFQPMKPHYSGVRLTVIESQIMPLLAEGIRYKEICKRIQLYPVSRLHSHLHRIRLKTGIRDTLDKEDCARFMEGYKPEVGLPSPQQIAAIRLFLESRGYQYVADQMGITKQSAMNYVCEGIKRLGVRGRGFHRKEQVRALLDSYEVRDDLMSDPVFN